MATLGETLFPKETIEHNYYGGTPVFFTKVWETHTTLEIEDHLFLLKRLSHDTNVSYVAFCVEKTFAGLTDPRLMKRVGDQADSKFIKEARERIGKLALEVFFETIFDRNKKAFWEYLSSFKNWTRQEEPLSPLIDPTSLCVFLDYFARSNEATKHNQKSNIRKFLRDVCNEPLLIDGNKIGICHWTEDARRTLANALVANGMYEECVEYDLPEAIIPLKLKFLGSAFTETGDGLTAISHTGYTMSSGLAMLNACNDREWRHVWSVLSIMEYKNDRAYLLNIVDPTDLVTGNQTPMSPKLALVFKSGFEDALQGF